LFLYFFLCAARLDYGAVMALFSSLPLVLLFGVMVVSLTLHGALGMQIIVEDYVHAPLLLRSLIVLNYCLCTALCFFGLWAIICLGVANG
ncbi:MAG: succinate dehydrogenase, hydrophobic membrane anchor protein, partial [Parvibaculales bacterium]